MFIYRKTKKCIIVKVQNILSILTIFSCRKKKLLISNFATFELYSVSSSEEIKMSQYTAVVLTCHGKMQVALDNRIIGKVQRIRLIGLLCSW